MARVTVRKRRKKHNNKGGLEKGGEKKAKSEKEQRDLTFYIFPLSPSHSVFNPRKK
jgi:hypothetical protein